MVDPDAKTIAAVGRLTEALETVERARGALYDFHQLTGEADFKIGDAAEQLREAGHAGLADEIEREIVGRNVIPDHWTFQIVEAYDEGYWSAVRAAERKVREQLTGGQKHLYEAQMKDERRTHGHPDHTAGPGMPEKSGE